MSNLFSIKDKIAIVTGGSSGIGAMIAKGFVEAGAKTYITARKADRLMNKADELSKTGTCIAIPADLSTLEGIEAFTKEIGARESKIDILVNNAGAAWGAPIDDYPESGWDKVMDINVKSIFFLTQKMLPLLSASGTAQSTARIINIASINGLTNSKMPTYAYTSSKAAVIHLTKHLASDLARDHISVNSIAPGYFATDMTSFLKENPAMAEQYIKQIPMHRMGQWEDAAGTAIYLSSKASGYLTGANITMDGGVVASA